MTAASEEGLRYVELGDVDIDDEPAAALLPDGAVDLETLRDEFVDAFNARDLDTLVSLARDDVECPDIHGDGIAALSEEISAIWERSPAAILTRGFLDDEPCALAWLPDEEGCWSRAALVCFAGDDGLLSVVSLPDDTDALDRAEGEDPAGEEQEEGTNWGEWTDGVPSDAQDRERARP